MIQTLLAASETTGGAQRQEPAWEADPVGLLGIRSGCLEGSWPMTYHIVHHTGDTASTGSRRASMGHSGSGRSPQPLRHEVGGLHISGIWSHHRSICRSLGSIPTQALLRNPCHKVPTNFSRLSTAYLRHAGMWRLPHQAFAEGAEVSLTRVGAARRPRRAHTPATQSCYTGTGALPLWLT